MSSRSAYVELDPCGFWILELQAGQPGYVLKGDLTALWWKVLKNLLVAASSHH